VIAKLGAEGVYSASLPELDLGVSLKVVDGDMKAAAIALVGVLDSLTARFGAGRDWPGEALAPWREPAIWNTRREVTGCYGILGELSYR
jgi:L-asparaginase II